MAGGMVALADVFDALTSSTVYRVAVSNEEAYCIIEEGAGRHFDPDMVGRFLANKSSLKEVQSASEGFDKKFLTDYLRHKRPPGSE